MSALVLIDRFERWSILTAEAAGLEWSGNGARITAIQQEIQEIEALQREGRFFDRQAVEPVHPLYHSIDEGELSGGFFRTMPSFSTQPAIILDLLAARICEDSPVPVGHHGATPNWHLALFMFGADIIAPCSEVLRHTLASLRYCHARLERLDGSDPVEAAPIGTDDARFEEAGVVDCDGNAEHATLIVRFSIDEGPLGPVMKMIEQRGNAARRILRGASA